MKLLGEILQLCKEYLSNQGIQSPRREAEDLLSDVLGLSRTGLYMYYDRPMTEEELKSSRERLRRRGRGEPLAYIHGSVSFAGCELLVTPDVLIPRQETEILIEQIIQKEKQQGRPLTSIVDMATGSGCIGIALKKAFPHAAVTLTDLSLKALNIAKANSEKNAVEVEVLQGDLLTPLEGRQFDLFVCNPPYISESDYAGLEREVQSFEPKSALVSGPSGFECYARLAKELSRFLAPGGRVWFEIGHGQSEGMRNLFAASPWTQQKVGLDWSQKERFFSLEKELSSLYAE